RTAAYSVAIPATKRWKDAYGDATWSNAAASKFKTVRDEAMKRFLTLGFPTTKHEDWHFTNVSAIAEAEWRTLAAASVDVPATSLAEFEFMAEWPMMVFVNGRFSPALSRLGALPPGVRVHSLEQAWSDERDILEHT